MRLKVVIFLILLTCFVTSCMDAKFILTGKPYPALKQDSYVKVYLERVTLKDFEEIGYVEVTNSSAGLDKVVEKVKETAIQKGANCIILIISDKSIGTTPSGDFTTTDKYRFKIGKIPIE